MGDAVRYWSATHNKWVEAHVQRVHRAAGGGVLSYDLTAKAQAPIFKVRNNSTPPDAPAPEVPPGSEDKAMPYFVGSVSSARMAQVGEILVGMDAALFAPPDLSAMLKPEMKVQYYSDTKTRWLDAEVEAKLDKGGVVLLDLTLKKGVPLDKVRVSAAEYEVGEDVEYWSTSVGRWVPAKVLKVFEQTALVDLDVKPGAQTAKIRKATGLLPKAPPLPQGFGQTTEAMGAQVGPDPKAAPPPPLACGFEVGDKVQYWSETMSRWIEALVEGHRERDGAVVYDLSCKRGTPADRVRPSPVASQERFQVGENVEYWSTSAGRWLPAKVLKMYMQIGQCDLDVKLGAPLGRLRRTFSNTANGVPSPPRPEAASQPSGTRAKAGSVAPVPVGGEVFKRVSSSAPPSSRAKAASSAGDRRPTAAPGAAKEDEYASLLQATAAEAGRKRLAEVNSADAVHRRRLSTPMRAQDAIGVGGGGSQPSGSSELKRKEDVRPPKQQQQRGGLYDDIGISPTKKRKEEITLARAASATQPRSAHPGALLDALPPLPPLPNLALLGSSPPSRQAVPGSGAAASGRAAGVGSARVAPGVSAKAGSARADAGGRGRPAEQRSTTLDSGSTSPVEAARRGRPRTGRSPGARSRSMGHRARRKSRSRSRGRRQSDRAMMDRRGGGR